MSSSNSNFDEKNQNTVGSVHDSIADLKTFKLIDVLQNNTNRKAVFLKGKFEGKEGDAVIILEKTSFDERHFRDEDNYFSAKNFLKKVFHNDIYGDYKYFTQSEHNNIKTTIIHPATEKHIIKYSTQNCYLIEETPQIYKDIVLPYLLQDQFNLQWVYNILEHKSESERIIVEDLDPDNGFVMVPDLKWNGDVDTLYLCAIIVKHGIKTLRDLTGEHLELLKNIKSKGTKAIKSKFDLDESQLRIYLHYHPSFYHLHVHFCNLRHEAPGISAERAHLLSTVINNIELVSDYYKKATLPLIVRENDKLFLKLELSGVLTKSC